MARLERCDGERERDRDLRRRRPWCLSSASLSPEWWLWWWLPLLPWRLWPDRRPSTATRSAFNKSFGLFISVVLFIRSMSIVTWSVVVDDISLIAIWFGKEWIKTQLLTLNKTIWFPQMWSLHCFPIASRIIIYRNWFAAAICYLDFVCSIRHEFNAMRTCHKSAYKAYKVRMNGLIRLGPLKDTATSELFTLYTTTRLVLVVLSSFFASTLFRRNLFYFR